MHLCILIPNIADKKIVELYTETDIKLLYLYLQLDFRPIHVYSLQNVIYLQTLMHIIIT